MQRDTGSYAVCVQASPLLGREWYEIDSHNMHMLTGSRFLAYFNTSGFLNAYGVFQEYYSSSLLSNQSQFKISWLGSVANFSIFIVAPAAGILADTIGPQIPIACGSVCLVVAVFMISLCKEYW